MRFLLLFTRWAGILQKVHFLPFHESQIGPCSLQGCCIVLFARLTACTTTTPSPPPSFFILFPPSKPVSYFKSQTFSHSISFIFRALSLVRQICTYVAGSLVGQISLVAVHKQVLREVLTKGDLLAETSFFVATRGVRLSYS